MCRDTIERTNFLRLIWLFIDIGTETLLLLFRHFIPNKDVVLFFSKDDVRTKLKELQTRKIISKLQLSIVSRSYPEIDKLDISFLITVLSNLFPSEIQPPKDGWFTNRPNKDDKSVAADIVRLRELRNKLVAHSTRVRLSDCYFEEYWGDLRAIFIRLHTFCGPQIESSNTIADKVDSYKTRNFDAYNQQLYEERILLLKESCKELIEIQEKMEELLRKMQEFTRFFRSKPERFKRYARLLCDGGRLVLVAFLQDVMLKRKLTIKQVLAEKNDDLEKQLGGKDEVKRLNGDIDTWTIHDIATVVEVFTGSATSPPLVKAVTGIHSALKGYAKSALESLDAERFSVIESDLISYLRILSLGLGENIQTQCEDYIDTYRGGKESISTSDTNDYLSMLHQSDVKSLEDVYKETLTELKEIIAQMEKAGIPFKTDIVLQLQLRASGEERIMAENILERTLKMTLSRTGSRTEETIYCRTPEECLLDQINEIPDVKVLGVERSCIIVSIQSSSTNGIYGLLDYFGSTLFQEQLFMVSSELTHLFKNNSVVAVTGNLTFETLHDLAVSLAACKADQKTGGLILPIACSSPKGMRLFLQMLKQNQTTNCVNRIAEQLSLQVEESISLQIAVSDPEKYILIPDDMETAFTDMLEMYAIETKSPTEDSSKPETLPGATSKGSPYSSQEIQPVSRTNDEHAKGYLFCENHQEHSAERVCLNHKFPLCTKCALEEASLGCDVKEITNLIDKENKILLDCFLEKQNLSRHLRLHKGYQEKTLTQKEACLKEINDRYEELSRTLEEKKDKSIARINEQSEEELSHVSEIMTTLEKLRKQVTDILQTLPEQSKENLDECAQQMETIRKSIKNAVACFPESLSGSCEQNMDFREEISKLDTIGIVSVIPNKTNIKCFENKPKDRNNDNRIRGSKQYDTFIKGQVGNFTGEIYRETSFSENVGKTPKDFVNKTLSLFEFHQDFVDACHFSKLVCLGKNRIALMSKVHGVVEIIGLDHKMFCKLSLLKPTGLVRMYDNEIAVLLGQRKIEKYIINEAEEVQSSGSLNIKHNEEIGNVTGFDYDNKSARFAISTSSKYIILDDSGKVLKVGAIPLHNQIGTDGLTIYDFENDYIYVLNRERKSVKCYSCSTSKWPWAKRYEETPNSFCLYKDVLCVTFDNFILSMSTMGKNLMNYGVNDLVDKCSVVCVDEDIIIFSSDSENVEKSCQLGFVRM